MYTVYLDLLIIENLLINYVILHISSIILRQNTRWYRLLVSAAVGCIYCVLSLYITHLLTSILLKVLLSIIMVLIAFRFKSIKQHIEIICIFYVVTFVFAGVTLVFFNTNKKYYIFLLSAMGYLICMSIIKIIQHHKEKSLMYKVYIKMEEKEVFLTAFLDTGNNLKDPFTNDSAIIVDYTALKPIIPKEVVKCITENHEEQIADISPLWASRFLILPFSTVSQENGLFKAFRCDYAVITAENQDTYIIKRAIIAIYFNNLSENNLFSALLSPDILYDRR